MSIATIHRLDKIVFPSANEIIALRNQRWDAGIQSLVEHTAGHPFPQFIATQAQKPLIGFTTPQLAAMLTECSVINGKSITTAINTYFKKGSITGNVARATTEHSLIAVQDVYLYWTRINLRHNEVATIDVVLATAYDGTNSPFAITSGSVALSGTMLTSSLAYFGAGPVEINTVSVGAIQEVTIESGIKLIEEGDASELYNTWTGLEMAQPTVTIKTLHRTNWATLGLAGVALDGSAGLEVWARKFASDGTRVANATAEHIKFTGLFGRAIAVDSNGEGTTAVTDTLKVELRANTDTGDPLTYSVASAIA
jgi:hypothetical protein